MRPSRSSSVMAFAAVVFAASASPSSAQSIVPGTVTATMTVGQTLVINKTITLGASGANLVDLFFLADNTGSMGGIINNAKAGAGAILGAVPAGASYNFGVGRYFGDPVEGVPPTTAYQQNTALTSSTAAAQTGINSWIASGGGDLPEANFYALQQVANTAAWRTGSQRLVVWFGDAYSHTATTTQAGAISALQAAGVTVIGFNSGSLGGGIDAFGQASAVTSATGGTLTNNFNGLSTAAFVAAVNAQISLATSTLDLVFGSTFVGTGLTLGFTCTDPLGCNNVGANESRNFQLTVTANTVGTYNFDVYADGVSATESDFITVVAPSTGVVPEPATVALLATGLLGLGAVSWRRKEEDEV